MAAPYSPFETTIRGQDYSQVNQDSPFALEEETTATPTVTRPTDLFKDDVAYNLIVSIDDTTRAAWNAWEMACKFQDEKKQDYYMGIICELANFMRKFKRITK